MKMASIATYKPGFIHDHEEWFERLERDLNWERRSDAPRSEYWTNLYDRPYTYGRGAGERTYEAKQSHQFIDTGREILRKEIGQTLEGCFLNMYGTRRDWLGWHSDDDPGINHEKPIAVITLGQGREIQWREIFQQPSDTNKKGSYGEIHTQMLESGSLFLMGPGMQDTYQHRIPKASFEVKPRISLTYRGLIA